LSAKLNLKTDQAAVQMRAAFALILIGMAVCSWRSAHGETRGLPPEIDFLDRNCLSIIEPQVKIRRCLAILNEVPPLRRPPVYNQISIAYYQLNDLDNALAYKALAVEAYGANQPDFEKLSSIEKRGWQGAYSGDFTALGTLQVTKSLLLSLSGNDDGAIAWSKKALTSFTSAIAINASNHKAYASRAEVNARLCKADDASSDKQSAIELATHAGDMKAVKEYNFINPHSGDFCKKP
jgi:tetratricopeptide (TPR) repeat protein